MKDFGAMGSVMAFGLGLWFAGSIAAEEPVKVRAERPRLFLRGTRWDGPSLEDIRTWLSRPEYSRRVEKLKSRDAGQALFWLLTGDAASGQKALEANAGFRISNEASPTYRGESAMQAAILYDWLRKHPGLDEATRLQRRADMEKHADAFIKLLSEADAPTPFYCRVSGSLAALVTIGIALQGDSPKADGYLDFAARFLREKIGTIRQVEDGASADGFYGYYHEFTHLALIAAAWRSATDWDAARWIAEQQGDWLRRQMLFQMRMTYPNGGFVLDGDMSEGDRDREQYRRQIDAVTGMYRNGFGRTWADMMQRRWPVMDGSPTDYHREYVWAFFVFNRPDVPALPLEEMPKCELFSRNLHGLVSWRDSWEDDATIINFKCGDTVSHHGTYDQGKFIIFKRVPLAIKDGGYFGYLTPKHWYYKSAWSANVVIFDHPQTHGYQPRVDMDGPQAWTEWKAARDRQFPHPMTGTITAYEANERFARVVGDLSGSTYPTGSTWTRELVFLGYKYLLVLDQVKPGPDVKTRWLLHSVNLAKLDPDKSLAVIDNGESRLFCKALLPEKAKLINVGQPDKMWIHKTAKGELLSWDVQRGQSVGRLDVVPPDASAECIYLHVLFPTDVSVTEMPACSMKTKGRSLAVTVGGMEHVFNL